MSSIVSFKFFQQFKYYLLFFSQVFILLLISQQALATCAVKEFSLRAGQTIDVGHMEVSYDENNLYVNFVLDNARTGLNAKFGTVHLWAGLDPALIPKSGGGAPIPGQFPYQFDVNGGLSHLFTIPLSELSIADIKNICGKDLIVVAHAEVTIDDGNGNVSQETAFGGDNVGDGNRWWYYITLPIDCTCLTTVPNLASCETAFAKGGYVWTTSKKSNPENLPSLNLTRQRWGWVNNLMEPTSGMTQIIYAGAGLNDVNKGTAVGTADLSWDGSVVTVTYNMYPGYLMTEIHIYAGDNSVETIAPGQYGSTAYFENGVANYSQQFVVGDSNGDGIWVVMHAVTCPILQ